MFLHMGRCDPFPDQPLIRAKTDKRPIDPQPLFQQPGADVRYVLKIFLITKSPNGQQANAICWHLRFNRKGFRLFFYIPDRKNIFD